MGILIGLEGIETSGKSYGMIQTILIILLLVKVGYTFILFGILY